MEPVSAESSKREWLITGVCQNNGISALQFFVKLNSILQAGGGVDEDDGNAIGEEIGGEASGRENGRDVFGEGFGSGGGDQARFTGAAVAGDDDSDAGTGAGGGGVSD